jgi:DNA-binding MarR family transcriptional regulator
MLHHPRDIVQREFVDMMDIDRHRISRTVREMVDAGLLEARQNPSSKRENLIRITSKGQGLFHIIAECANVVLDRAFNGCSEQEKEITENVLQKIIYNLSES